MEYFKPAIPPFSNDLETNRLLRAHRNLPQAKPRQVLVRHKALRLVLLVIFGVPFYFLRSRPSLNERAWQQVQKYKRCFPVWLKKSLKVALQILPRDSHVALDGIYELNIMHPTVLDRGFGLPTSTEPEISIIIPVHNHIRTTLALLHQLRFNSDLAKFEVIIVDDASTDSTTQVLAKIRGISVLTQTINVGYLRATNSAIRHSKGKYICLLNNDTVPESGWLDALLRALKNDPKIAIAGSMLISADGKVAEVGSQIFQNHEIWNLGRWAQRGSELFNFTREVDYCSAAAILVDGAFLRSLNGFDERYIPAYYEDTDLATTAWSQGRKVVYVHDSFVHHIEGVSHGTDSSQGLKAYQVVNKQKFWDKWEKTINLPWSLNEIPRYEADRDSKGIIVFIDNFIPSINSNAGATRAFKIIEAMRQLKFHIVVIPTNPGVEIWNREQLHQKGIEIYQSYDEALDNLKMRASRINSFWVSRVDVGEIVIPRIKADFPRKLIIFDTVDLHHLRDARNIKINDLSSAIYSSDIKERELEICREANKVVVVADYEKKYLNEQVVDLNVHTLFMPQSSSTVLKDGNAKNFILFVGNFQHTPNVDGIEWLVDHILPRVFALGVGQLELHIVGEGLPDSVLKKLDPSKVKYLGWQESLEEIYSQARFVVIPMRYGAGKKGKLAEAVMHNCPVISTTVGVEGYPLENGADFVLADGADDVAQAIFDLWNDSTLATDLAISAKAKILEESGFDAFIENVAAILEVVDQ